MSDTHRAPGRTRKSRKDKTNRGVGQFLSKPWWAGIGAIAAVIAIGGAVAAVIAVLPSEQHPTQSTSVGPVRFSDLRQIAVSRFGLIFSYPSDWDQQYLLENSDGAEFVNPDDTAVSVTGYGTHDNLTRYSTIFDAEKEWKGYILSLRNARIIEATASGTATEDAKGRKYAVDGWRVVYRYVNAQGHFMMDMVKSAVANGREVDLVMEAPAREFPRYKGAFLELSSKLLLLTQCIDCSTQ